MPKALTNVLTAAQVLLPFTTYMHAAQATDHLRAAERRGVCKIYHIPLGSSLLPDPRHSCPTCPKVAQNG